MTQALEESDLQTVARQAHKLKPSSGIIGADVATNLALQIEVIAEKNDPNKQLPSMLKSLGNALDNCYRDLSKYQSEVQN